MKKKRKGYMNIKFTKKNFPHLFALKKAFFKELKKKLTDKLI